MKGKPDDGETDGMTESTFDPTAATLAVAQRENTSARRVRAVTKLMIHLLLIVGGFAVLIPFFWMVSSSLKPDWEIFSDPAGLDPGGAAVAELRHRPDRQSRR